MTENGFLSCSFCLPVTYNRRPSNCILLTQLEAICRQFPYSPNLSAFLYLRVFSSCGHLVLTWWMYWEINGFGDLLPRKDAVGG